MAKQEGLQLTEVKKRRFFYGYVIVLVAFVIMTLTFGVNYSFGVFFKPLLIEFGWTRAVTSAAYSLMTLVSGFLGIFAGKLSDRFGSKVVCIAGGLFLGFGALLMSQVNAIWQLYLFYGLIIAAGVGACWPALLSTVARWFVVRRGLMTGIVASGIGFGIVIIPPVATRLISNYGWRPSYIIIGIIALVLIILAAQFLKRDPRQKGLLPYGENEVRQESLASENRGFSLGEAIHTGQFWMIGAIYFCFGFFLHNIMVHVVPHAIELGISSVNAAYILAIIGGMSIIGRIAIGGASDRIGIKSSLIVVFILASVVLFWLQLAKEPWMLYLFAAVFGFAYGGTISLQPLAVAELFGLSSLGVTLGSVAFLYTIGGAVSPLLAGHIFDITGSYYLAFLISATVAIIGLILVLFLKPIRGSTENI